MCYTILQIFLHIWTDEEGVNDEQHVANVKQLLSDYENSERV